MSTLFDDPRFVRRLLKRLEEGWSSEKVRAMSTGEIVARLASFNVPFDEATFREDIRHYRSAEVLADTWWERHDCTATGYDEDFIWMAAIVLWERLAPDVTNVEMINRLMQDGYDYLEQHDLSQACDTWWQTWERIKEMLSPEMTTVEAFDNVFRGTQFVSNWCQDFEMELHNAGLRDPAYFHRRITYCREFCAQFRDEEELLLGNFYRAEADSWWHVGEVGMAEQKFRELVARYPNFAWGYIGWADGYWLFRPDKRVPPDYDRAEAIYLQALDNPHLEDRKDVLDRLADLCEEKGDRAKAAEYRRQRDRPAHRVAKPEPQPEPPPPPTARSEPSSPSSLMPKSIPRVGRNAPCPCGSGKKYKHCHGKPGKKKRGPGK
jgi:tetratricopeptide (TPR) repeat protein